jgi:hypothetical protein
MEDVGVHQMVVVQTKFVLMLPSGIHKVVSVKRQTDAVRIEMIQGMKSAAILMVSCMAQINGVEPAAAAPQDTCVIALLKNVSLIMGILLEAPLAQHVQISRKYMIASVATGLPINVAQLAFVRPGIAALL